VVHTVTTGLQKFRPVWRGVEISWQLLRVSSDPVA